MKVLVQTEERTVEASERWSDRCREVDAAYENVRRLLNNLTGVL